MEERKQPGRSAKRKSEDTSSAGDYDYGDDMDDLQGRLDRLLGRDSDSDANYNPDSGDDDTVSSDGGKKDPIEDGVRNIDLNPVGDNENDEMSEDSDIENMRQKRKIATAKRRVTSKTKSKKLNVGKSGDGMGMAVKKRGPGRPPGIKFKREITEDMVYFHEMRKVPSLVKECLDLLHPKFHEFVQAKYFSRNSISLNSGEFRAQAQHRLPENPHECLSLMVKIMEQPKEFFNLAAKRAVQWNYEVEEYGLLTLDLVQRLFTSKTLYLETVLNIGKMAHEWRARCKWSNRFEMVKGVFKNVPKTMSRCAQLLIEGGDLAGLYELFEKFDRNCNTKNEVELQFMRSVAAMIKLVTGSQDVETLSVGGSSVAGPGTGGLNLPPDTITASISSFVRAGGHVDWVMPLYSAFLLEETSSDTVLELLTEYRAQHPAHLPAHKQLLEFLHHQGEEEETLLPHLKLCVDTFPSQVEYVLKYCEVLIKSQEDDLNTSFGSDHSDGSEGEESHGGRVARELQTHTEIVRAAVSCLDYSCSRDNLVLWTYLAESLKAIHSEEMLSDIFQERKGWWKKLNFSNVQSLSNEILIKKAVVCLLLFGAEDGSFTSICDEIDRRRSLPDSSYFHNLAKELDLTRSRVTVTLASDAAMDDPKPSMEEEQFVADEWKKLKRMKKKEKRKEDKVIEEAKKIEEKRIAQKNIKIKDKEKLRKKKKTKGRPSLPNGWVREVNQRLTRGYKSVDRLRYEVYIYSPAGDKFRSKNEIRRYIEMNNLQYDPKDFDFSTRLDKGKKYKCDVCEKEYTWHETMKVHKKSAHPSEDFFSTRYIEMNNLQYDPKDFDLYSNCMYKCDVCEKGYSRKDTLTKHKKSAHPSET